MGLLLSIAAYTLLIILIIPSILIGLVVTLINHTSNGYFVDIAISLDKLGNVICQHLLNLTLIQKNGFKFGSHMQTVSHVLGVNFKDKTLSKLGLWICNRLDSIDKNHVENASIK